MLEEFNKEYCNPYNEDLNYYMRVEHLGRYLFAKDYVKDNDVVLDVACCDGYGTVILSNFCKTIDGIDNKKEYIKDAKNNNNSFNINYINEDIDTYEFNKKYDLVVCFETIEHIKYPELFLKKISRALNKNGLMLLSFPNSKYEQTINGKNLDPYHLHIFEKSKIEQIIKKYFTIIDILGQSTTNKIVNDKIKYQGDKDLYQDSLTIGKPNKIDIDDTYSYIYILKVK